VLALAWVLHALAAAGAVSGRAGCLTGRGLPVLLAVHCKLPTPRTAMQDQLRTCWRGWEAGYTMCMGLLSVCVMRGAWVC
jgi:hypothetical protein